MSIKRLIAGLAGAPLVAGLAMPALVFAADPVTVTPVDTQGWSTAETRNTGSVTYTSEYGAPTGFGHSALKLDTPAGNDKAQYAHSADKALLNEINDISYYAYRSSASTTIAGQAPAVNLTIDFNGAADGGFATLVYEPIYQTGGAAAVHNDEWQKWTADGSSIWWSTKVMPGVTNAFTSYVSLADIQAANPDATVTDVRLNQGSGNAGLVSGVDGLTFNGTTYNFEVFQPTGEITSPAAGEHVRGTVTLAATYNDGDNVNDDAVQWALRSSCNDNTTTVAGNVDGFNTPYTWDGANFSATVDTSTFEPGSYCFVFNPKDDAGQNDVRLTRTFVVDANAPVNKDECKNDGWQNFTAPAFKNQGDCVSFIASGGKAKDNPVAPAVRLTLANDPRF